MKFRVLALAIAATVAAPAFAAVDQNGGTLRAIRNFPTNTPVQFGPSTEVVDGTSFYSNVTTFLGQAFPNGGAAVDPALAANTITRLLCDDTTYNAATGRSLSGLVFGVANLNAAAVSARARVRFYSDAAGVPGTYITGYSFNAFTFSPGVTLLSGTVTAFPLPGTGAAVKIWSCITFDNGSGATGATVADLNNFGMGLYNPVDRGSSADQYFLTTNNGSFVGPNPAGATGNLGGAPVANFGWELTDAVTMPVELQSFEVK